MTDARNIALTVEATAAADRIVDRFGLEQRVDAVRIGIAYAIQHRLDTDRSDLAPLTGSNYNVATVDTADGTFRRLALIFHDDVETLRRPYHAIETLMNKGLVLLRQHLDDGTVSGLGDLASGSDAERQSRAS